VEYEPSLARMRAPIIRALVRAHSPTLMSKHPRVGVGIILRRTSDGAVVVGERKGSHGAHTLALPGGALEWRETARACASRECVEECALVVPEDAWECPFAITETVIDDDNHWITIFALAHVEDWVKIENAEPRKCAGWTFREARDIEAVDAERVFSPLRVMLNACARKVEDARAPREFVANADGVFAPAPRAAV